MEKMEKLCLDTNVLVNLLRNKQEEVMFIKESESIYDLSISSITLYELYYGALKSNNSDKNMNKVKEITEDLEILDFTSDCAEAAAIIQSNLEKSGNSIEIRDLFIASVALKNDCKLKTGNKKHFDKIPNLTLV